MESFLYARSGDINKNMMECNKENCCGIGAEVPSESQHKTLTQSWRGGFLRNVSQRK